MDQIDIPKGCWYFGCEGISSGITKSSVIVDEPSGMVIKASGGLAVLLLYSFGISVLWGLI